jgi:hypothetical protein
VHNRNCRFPLLIENPGRWSLEGSRVWLSIVHRMQRNAARGSAPKQITNSESTDSTIIPSKHVMVDIALFPDQYHWRQPGTKAVDLFPTCNHRSCVTPTQYSSFLSQVLGNECRVQSLSTCIKMSVNPPWTAACFSKRLEWPMYYVRKQYPWFCPGVARELCIVKIQLTDTTIYDYILCSPTHYGRSIDSLLTVPASHNCQVRILPAPRAWEARKNPQHRKCFG